MNKKTVMLFKALGCRRLKILSVFQKVLCASASSDDLFPIDKTTLSRHVKALVDAKLIVEKRGMVRERSSA